MSSKMNVYYCWWPRWKDTGTAHCYVSGSTHLIRVMFQRAVVTHVSNPVQICVSLVDIVHVGTVVLFIKYAYETEGHVILTATAWTSILTR